MSERFKGPEKDELTIENKRNLIGAWLDIAVEKGAEAAMENKSEEEVKNWLYETLVTDAERLIREWGIKPDESMTEEIKAEKNSDRRSALEMEYLNSIRLEINKFREKNDDGSKSTKWDSWPKKMREARAFNCVGATLIGIAFLNKIKIESYYANPYSHVLNIVRLSNGEWVYADFNNNSVKKIKAEETELGGVETLKLKDPEIIYEYIPLHSPKEAPASILGNLDSLEYEVKNKSTDPLDRKEAEKFIGKYGDWFGKINFASLRDALYPSRGRVWLTEEMKEEETRIRKMRSLGNLSPRAREYVKTIKPERANELISEIRSNIGGIRELFYKGDETVLGIVAPELKKILRFLLEDLRKTKETDRELFHDFVEQFINK